MEKDNYDPLAAYASPTFAERLRALAAGGSPVFFGLLLAAAIALLYWHSLSNPLVFDDKPFFVASNLKQYGTSLFHFDLRWISYASFGWTYDLFGLNFFWYRLGNLALHALTCIVLFIFFNRLLVATTTSPTAAKPSPWPAFFATLIFALHPAAVYGTAYLVERSIIMATLFGILMLLSYLEGLARNQPKWLVVSALFYFLAVFSKEHSVMLPAVAAALTLLLHRPSPALARKVALPFALYLAIAVLIVLRAKGVLGAPYEPFAAEMLSRMSDHQHSVRIENAYALSLITQGYLFFKYLLLWIVPNPGWMSVDIRQPFAAGIFSWPEIAGFVAFLAYPAVAIRFLLRGGRQGLLGFGMLFPWLLFLTELSAVRIQEPFVLYRSYLWMSGLPVLLLALLGSSPKKPAYVLLAAASLLSAALAWNRLDTFSSSFKLWSDVIAENGEAKLLGAERGYNNRGFAYLESGRLQEARADFEKALTLNPENPESNLNVGIVNFRQGRIDEALQYYAAAIKARPDYRDAYMNLGVALLQAGRYAQALANFEQLLQRNPKDAEVYLNRGMAYLKMGKMQEAMNDIDEAIHFNPDLATAYMNRGIMDAMQGHAEPALADMDKAIRLAPDNAEIHFNRGIVQGMAGHSQEALLDYNRAIELNPEYADAYVNRGGLYMVAGRLPEAISEFNRAIQINPAQENAYLNRANVFAAQSRYRDAIDDYDKVLELNPKNGQALLNRGFMLLALKEKAQAQESFRKSCDAGIRKGCELLR